MPPQLDREALHSAAVKDLQSAHDPQPDGDVGPLTFKALVVTPPPDPPTSPTAVWRQG